MSRYHFSYIGNSLLFSTAEDWNVNFGTLKNHGIGMLKLSIFENDYGLQKSIFFNYRFVVG